MKNKTKLKLPEYEIKWWKDWLEADCLEREKKVEKLPFPKMCIDISAIKDKNLQKHSISTMLNGYFEDLESAIYTKIAREKIIKGRRRNLRTPHTRPAINTFVAAAASNCDVSAV